MVDKKILQITRMFEIICLVHRKNYKQNKITIFIYFDRNVKKKMTANKTTKDLSRNCI